MSSNSKNSCMFVVLSFSDRVEMPETTEGIFYSLQDKDVALPCIDRNGLYSPVEGLSKGRGDIPIYCLHKIFIPMLKNSTSAIAQSPAITATEILDSILLSGNLTTMRQHLREMADTYLLSEDEFHYRQLVYATYMELDNVLRKVENLINQNERRVV